MKHIFAKLTVAALILTATVAVAQNQRTNIATGVTWVGPGGTSNTASTAWIEVKNHEKAAIQWAVDQNLTNALVAANVYSATIGGSMVPSNFVAIDSITNRLGTTTNTLTTYAGKEVNLGSFRYLSIMSIYNGGTNATVTNRSLSGTAGTFDVQFKDKRNGQ